MPLLHGGAHQAVGNAEDRRCRGSGHSGRQSHCRHEAFLAAGYTRRNLLEVVLGVGTKVLSNYTNHLVHTPLDPFMAGAEWSKPGSSRAA
ncbi:MAG: hypothetical protein MUE84_02500 [Hyphomonas sp.]|nr:hypothetical protein [Hyphomonas sp.]